MRKEHSGEQTRRGADPTARVPRSKLSGRSSLSSQFHTDFGPSGSLTPVQGAHLKDENEAGLGPRQPPHCSDALFPLLRAGVGGRLGTGTEGGSLRHLSRPVSSLHLQPACPTLQVQLGALPAVRWPERGRLRAVPPPHGRAALPLLPAGVLEGPQPAYYQPQGLQG